MRDLSFIRIILENPQAGKNVGSVCRAMKNMGLSRLYIAGTPPEDLPAASVTAIHAADILDRAVFCTNVEEALRGTVLSAALSRRRGKKRKYFSIYPEELARMILALPGGGPGDASAGAPPPAAASQPEAAVQPEAAAQPEVGLVFGNEISGLSEEDMALCSLAVMIPANEAFPSLNLSHAVQIVAYEIYKAARAEGSGHRAAGYTPLDRAALEALCGSLCADLGDLGFFKQVPPDDMEIFFRDIFARAAVSPREAERLKKIFSKIRGLARANKS